MDEGLGQIAAQLALGDVELLRVQARRSARGAVAFEPARRLEVVVLLVFGQGHGEAAQQERAFGVAQGPLVVANRSEFTIDRPGFIVHPDDVIGTERHPDLMRWIGFCQGPSGSDGLNLVCSGCGAEVATRQADCYTQDQVALEPNAVCLSFTDD